MIPLIKLIPLLSFVVFGTQASPLQYEARADGVVSSATLDGVTYLNKGLVGFGFIPASFKDSTGDTMGGFGSSIALKRGSWKEKKGEFTGVLYALPDRGFNVDHTVDYQARRHEIKFTFTPYYGSAPLDYSAQTLQLAYHKTTLLYERLNKKTTGLDPLAVRTTPLVPGDPQLPIASTADPRLSLDVEGTVVNEDKSFWISDEYGPYIYHYKENGDLISIIQPPDAIVPRNSAGDLNFTSASNPATGRIPNQGFEGLTFDEDTSTLYAMLQSAAIQDGGNSKATSRYTRLLAWDVSDPSHPVFKGEWVVPLPVNSAGNTLGCSEIHFVSNNVFLALSRDGDGNGGSSPTSKYKNAGLFSIASATDIHGTKFDQRQNPIAVQGVLDSSITPAHYVDFVNYLDTTQLSRFGLHNGLPIDQTLIAGKWESLALAPVCDPAFPDDYFLITAADNDFLTKNGVSVGQPYNAGAGLDVDNQVLVWRLTLPSVPRGKIEDSVGKCK
jgi:hypothetical protein